MEVGSRGLVGGGGGGQACDEMDDDFDFGCRTDTVSRRRTAVKPVTTAAKSSATVAGLSDAGKAKKKSHGTCTKSRL